MAASAIGPSRRNSNWEHLRDELVLLNSYLLREVNERNNNRQQSQLDQLQGLVLSEEEILAILTDDSAQAALVREEQDLEEAMKDAEEFSQQGAEVALRATSQLNQLRVFFGLQRIEEQCLVLCLAPEIDPKYSKVFAFLQDDITKKQPSVDVALRLFCADLRGRLAARAIFAPNSSLLRRRLLHLGDPADRHSALSLLTLKLDDRIAAFLLCTPQVDEHLADWVEIVLPAGRPPEAAVPDEIRDRTLRLVENCFAGGQTPMRPLIHLYGRRGSGRRSLASAASERLGLPLLVADVRRMPPETNGAEAMWRLGREALLLPAALLVEGFDDLLPESRRHELTALLSSVSDFSPLTFLSGTQPWKAENPEQLFLSLQCPVPNSTARLHYWSEHLKGSACELGADDLIELSSKFNFTEGQIRQTVEAARCQAYWESEPELNGALLSRVGRSVATPSLSGLARKIKPGFVWSDIVLPETQLLQLREIVAHVKRAQVIFDEWGFDEKFAYGKGVSALFEGPSGTGKTMAAGIIAAELALDLYRIDLSSVVSKYIGETEKNLERIFTEAQDSNVILFFDEADALFGKRSEVKDAHDRYANVETAYLLQRMEEYGGVAILASNMKQNVDEAFVRRMRFIIPFPFPAEEDRACIWRKSFPAGAPLGDVDFGWLARHLKITGGNIKSISLRAAFMAAERQSEIGMDCLIEAAKREMEKIGKISALAEYRVRPPQVETI
jgi:hypothetical protein